MFALTKVSEGRSFFRDRIRPVLGLKKGFHWPGSAGYHRAGIGHGLWLECKFMCAAVSCQKSTGAHKKICFLAISARWTRNVWQVGVTDDMGPRWYLVSDWGLNTVAGFSQPCGEKGLFCYSFTKARLEGDVSCRIKLAMCKVTSSGHWVLHKWLQARSLDLFLMLPWEKTTSSLI